MRTLAIGDIHGCYRSLAALESFATFKPDDRIITLGDYVDRGPDSKSVIQWLIDRDSDGNLIPLRGNHELTPATVGKQTSPAKHVASGSMMAHNVG